MAEQRGGRGRRKTWLWIVMSGVVLLAGLLFYGVWYYAQREEPVVYPSDPIELFKYAPIGTEKNIGIPYPIWKVLPNVCSEKLPGGYRSLGFIYESGQERPIGIAMRTIGIPRVAPNCALCHTGTVRVSEQGETQVILGMPAHQLQLQKYVDFLHDCGSDSHDFNPDAVMVAIQKEEHLSWIESLIYRYLIIPETGKALQALYEKYPWHSEQYPQPAYGSGRVNTFFVFQVGFDVSGDPVGVVDFPSVWNQGPRDGMFLHWDGNNDSLAERNKSAAISAGASPDSIDMHSLDAIEAWLKTLSPPKYPFPIDDQLVAKGQPIYQAHCASCHDLATQDQIGKVTPIEEIGTDPHRFNSFSIKLVEHMNTIGTGYPWQFTHFRKSNGYANMPLDGIWARAPYLHNGSVPNLRELLELPEKRTQVFYIGYDVYDPENVWFIFSGPEAERVGFELNTSLPGNSNSGHLYGTELSAEEKEALIEFLKTQ